MKISEELRDKIISRIEGVQSVEGGKVYLQYDSITIDMKKMRVEFSYLDHQMAYMDLPRSFARGDSLTISGLDGKISAMTP